MIIGLSGHKQSGKDTVAKIIQYLVFLNDCKDKSWSYQNFSDEFDTIIRSSASNYSEVSGWQIKQFASKLKQIVCLLIRCTMEQLENEGFKKSRLSKEWSGSRLSAYINDTEEVLPTVRLLLQNVGTEFGRNLHPNIWVNALMSEYTSDNVFTVTEADGMSGTQELVYPNWIVTDVRFENEVKAIKDKEGIIIRINRNTLSTDTHESEIILDNYKDFDFEIDNDRDIKDLIGKIKAILHILKII